jgi:hypothetical protein
MTSKMMRGSDLNSLARAFHHVPKSDVEEMIALLYRMKLGAQVRYSVNDIQVNMTYLWGSRTAYPPLPVT